MIAATSALILRKFSLDDTSKVFLMSREIGMQEWIPDQVYKDEKHTADVLQYLIDGYDAPDDPRLGPFVLGVCLKSTLELIGHVGLSPYRGEVEIGYAIEAVAQGRGLATEAVSAACTFGFERFGLSRIVGIAHGENVASCRVLEKAGFILDSEVDGKLHGRPGLIRTYYTTPG